MSDIKNLTEEALKAKYKARVELRLNHPGLCCHDFENIIALVEKHVIGWDTKTGTARSVGGLFGTVDAFCGAIEEQGRKRLHIHYAIFLKGWSDMLQQLFYGSDDEKEITKEEIAQWVDNGIASTQLLGNRICYKTGDKE